jgi:hypothetical protein
MHCVELYRHWSDRKIYMRFGKPSRALPPLTSDLMWDWDHHRRRFNVLDEALSSSLILVHSYCKHVSIISTGNEITLHASRAAAARSDSIEALRNPDSPCLALQCSCQTLLHRSTNSRLILCQPLRRGCRPQTPNRSSSQPARCAGSLRGW